MDERVFQQTCRALNPLACPFEKAILICQCACSEAKHVNVAERDTVNCRNAQAQEDCSLLVGMLRHKAAFALKLTHADAVLSHAKHVKVQCGGLLGLRAVMQPEQSGAGQVADIRGLVLEAQERFGGLQELPYSEIVRGIAGFEFRRRPWLR